MPSAAIDGVVRTVRRLGAATLHFVGRLGYAARFFVAVVGHSPAAFRRLHLTLRPGRRAPRRGGARGRSPP